MPARKTKQKQTNKQTNKTEQQTSSLTDNTNCMKMKKKPIKTNKPQKALSDKGPTKKYN